VVRLAPQRLQPRSGPKVVILAPQWPRHGLLPRLGPKVVGLHPILPESQGLVTGYLVTPTKVRSQSHQAGIPKTPTTVRSQSRRASTSAAPPQAPAMVGSQSHQTPTLPTPAPKSTLGASEDNQDERFFLHLICLLNHFNGLMLDVKQFQKGIHELVLWDLYPKADWLSGWVGDQDVSMID
jgi:hypothetical protein